MERLPEERPCAEFGWQLDRDVSSLCVILLAGEVELLRAGGIDGFVVCGCIRNSKNRKEGNTLEICI